MLLLLDALDRKHVIIHLTSSATIPTRKALSLLIFCFIDFVRDQVVLFVITGLVFVS